MLYDALPLLLFLSMMKKRKKKEVLLLLPPLPAVLLDDPQKCNSRPLEVFQRLARDCQKELQAETSL